jgi:hypothetical protein
VAPQAAQSEVRSRKVVDPTVVSTTASISQTLSVEIAPQDAMREYIKMIEAKPA